MSQSFKAWLQQRLESLGLTDNDEIADYIVAIISDEDTPFSERAETIVAYAADALDLPQV